MTLSRIVSTQFQDAMDSARGALSVLAGSAITLGSWSSLRACPEKRDKPSRKWNSPEGLSMCRGGVERGDPSRKEILSWLALSIVLLLIGLVVCAAVLFPFAVEAWQHRQTGHW